MNSKRMKSPARRGGFILVFVPGSCFGPRFMNVSIKASYSQTFKKRFKDMRRSKGSVLYSDRFITMKMA